MARQKKNNDELTELETRFLSVYMYNGFNGSAAYKLVKPGCQATTARTEAAKILAKQLKTSNS